MRIARSAVYGGMLAYFLTPLPGVTQQFENFDDFREAVEDDAVADLEAFERRLEAFRDNPGERQALLEQAREELAAAEARSTELENTFEENELLVADVRAQHQQRLGALNELFGVLQQVAGDARNRFRLSLTNIQYGERIRFLSDFNDKLAESDVLPSVSEIERLWFELLREAVALGRVERLLEQRYVTSDGREVREDVVRVGAFNVVADGRYLQYSPESGSISEVPRQPGARFVDSASALVNAAPGDGLTPFGIDIESGTVIDNLADTPRMLEYVDDGGLPGYVIIALGAIGILMSLERLVTLGIAGRKVKAQLKRDVPSDDNALGRVLRVHEHNRDVDTETLELKLSEAILKETPSLQRGILFIKIISVVAPLLGLLGTVIGMISTFESITLFGTADPSIMASGISQALVTTALGLTVAIPTVLLHTIVSGRSRAIIQVLQQRTAGIVADHARKAHAARTA